MIWVWFAQDVHRAKSYVTKLRDFLLRKKPGCWIREFCTSDDLSWYVRMHSLCYNLVPVIWVSEIRDRCFVSGRLYVGVPHFLCLQVYMVL